MIPKLNSVFWTKRRGEDYPPKKYTCYGYVTKTEKDVDVYYDYERAKNDPNILEVISTKDGKGGVPINRIGFLNKEDLQKSINKDIAEINQKLKNLNT